VVSESDGSCKGQRSLGGNDEASSLHLHLPIDGLLLYDKEQLEQWLMRLVDVVQLVHVLALLKV